MSSAAPCWHCTAWQQQCEGDTLCCMLKRSMTEHGSNLSHCHPGEQLASCRAPQHHCTTGETHSTPPRTTLTGRFRWWEMARALLPCTHAWSACCRGNSTGLTNGGSGIEMQQSQCTFSRPGRKIQTRLSHFGRIHSCCFLRSMRSSLPGTRRAILRDKAAATHMVPMFVPLAPHARVVKVVSMVLIVHIATFRSIPVERGAWQMH